MSVFSTLRPIEGSGQNLTFGAASAQSAAVGVHTTDVRIVATAACRIRIGPNPTAVATDTLIPANVPEYLHVAGGDKIAAIQDSAGGTLNITEMTR